MSFNGSGVFLRVMNWTNDALANIKIRADRHDLEDDNLANGLTNCVTRDGQSPATANLPMGGFKHTNVADAGALNEYATAGQILDGELVYYTAAGTDTYTITTVPLIDSYEEGQAFFVKFTNANTGAATINANSIGAVALVKGASTALDADDLPAGVIKQIIHDGTNFQVKDIPASLANYITAASSIAAKTIVRGDDGVNGVKGSGVTLDDSNNMIWGAATRQGAGSGILGTPLIEINNIVGNSAGISLLSWSTGTDAGGSLNLGRSDSGTIGTHQALGNNDVSGSLRWFGSDGTAFIPMARIHAIAQGAASANNVPTRQIFSINSGSAALTEYMSVYANRGVVLDTATGGSQGAGILNAKGYELNGVNMYPVAMCSFNGTGTPAFLQNSGFSGIVDNGNGDYTLNSSVITTNSIVQVSTVSGNTSLQAHAWLYSVPASGSVRVATGTSSTNFADQPYITVTVYNL